MQMSKRMLWYKRSGDFYVSYNENRDKSGYLPFCKDCLKAMCLDRSGNIDKKKMGFPSDWTHFSITFMDKSMRLEGVEPTTDKV